MNGIVNYLTQSDVEALAVLTEEMGESLRIVGKIERHGFDSEYRENGMSNTELLEYEIGHVLAAIDILVERGLIDRARLVESRGRKLVKVQGWLHSDLNIAAAKRLIDSDASGS